MNKSPRFAFLAAGGLILVLTTLFLLLPSDQQYQGRTLHEWVSELANRSTMTSDLANEPLRQSPAQEQAAAAIRHFGVDALPTLLYALQDGKEPGFIGSLKRFYRNRNLPEVGPGRLEHWQAAAALEVLGTNATSAIPTLVKMLKGPTRDGKAAAMALAAMGDEGRKALLWAVSEGSIPEQSHAVWAIGQRGLTNNDLFLPLLNCVTNHRSLEKPTAAWALARTQLYPEISIPAIVAEATRTNCQYPPYYFVPSVAAFKQHAPLMIPHLVNCLEDSRPAVRQFAIKAIRELGPIVIELVPTISKIAETDNDRGTRMIAGETLAGLQLVPSGSKKN